MEASDTGTGASSNSEATGAERASASSPTNGVPIDSVPLISSVGAVVALLTPPASSPSATSVKLMREDVNEDRLKRVIKTLEGPVNFELELP